MPIVMINYRGYPEPRSCTHSYSHPATWARDFAKNVFLNQKQPFFFFFSTTVNLGKYSEIVKFHEDKAVSDPSLLYSWDLAGTSGAQEGFADSVGKL